METVRAHLSRRVIGYLALFVALGGTYGVATGSTDSREIKNESVCSKDLRNNDVRARDIVDSTIGTADVANGSLLAADFATGQLPRGPQGTQRGHERHPPPRLRRRESCNAARCSSSSDLQNVRQQPAPIAPARVHSRRLRITRRT